MRTVGRDRGSRPWLVEFAGTPRAGKTTVMRGLADSLIDGGQHVCVVDEQATRCPVPSKDHPHFNLWTGASTMCRIVEGLYSEADVVLVDRGLFDTLCWLEWYHRRGLLSSEDHQFLDRLVYSQTMTGLVDLVVVMIVDPVLALERESSIRPRVVPGTIMNCGTLEDINHSIRQVSKRYAAAFRIESVDTSGMDAAEALARVEGIVHHARPAPGQSRGHS